MKRKWSKDLIWSTALGEYISVKELCEKKSNQKKRWKNKNKASKARRDSGRR